MAISPKGPLAIVATVLSGLLVALDSGNPLPKLGVCAIDHQSVDFSGFHLSNQSLDRSDFAHSAIRLDCALGADRFDFV